MRRYAILLLALILLVSPLHADGQTPDQGACFEKVSNDFKTLNAEYRSVLLGSRRDRDGKFSVLTGGFTDRVRTGIFEMKGRETSELIDPALESFRVYRCKMTSVCEVMSQSFGSNDQTPFPVQPLGCESVTLTRYPECYFAGPAQSGSSSAPSTNASTQLSALDMITACREFVNDSVQTEAAVLRLIVGYDAGYRSLLQYAGMMDWMMEGFPEQTIRAVADMVNLLGKLHQIPCYIGQCDLPNTDSL